MSVVEVIYVDSLFELKGVWEEKVEFEGTWTLKGMVTFLCQTYDFWWKSLRRKDKPVFYVNEKVCSEEHPIKNGDQVFIFNDFRPKLLGEYLVLEMSTDYYRQKYEYIAAVQEGDGIESIPEIVLPSFDKLSTEITPEVRHQEHYPEHLVQTFCDRMPNRVCKYVGRSGKVPEAEYYSDIARFHEVWQKLNDDLVRALCDGLHHVSIVHGDSYAPLKHNIRHWLMGCDWVLAYLGAGYSSEKSVIVELKRLKDDLRQYW